MKAYSRFSPLSQFLLSLFFAGALLAQETNRAFIFETDVKADARRRPARRQKSGGRKRS